MPIQGLRPLTTASRRGAPSFALELLVLAALAGHVAAAQAAWTLDTLQMQQVPSIRQFQGGRFVTRMPPQGAQFLEVVGTLRSAQGSDAFGPMAYGDVLLESEGSSGKPWQAPVIAIGTHAAAGCQYVPADLPPGYSTRLALEPAGEIRLARGAPPEPLKISIEAAEVRLCLAFEASAPIPANGNLRIAGRTFPFGTSPGEGSGAAILKRALPWLTGAVIFALVGAGVAWQRRRARSG